jgi:hypothetical protein
MHFWEHTDPREAALAVVRWMSDDALHGLTGY